MPGSAAKLQPVAATGVRDAFTRRRRFSGQVLAFGELGIGAGCFLAVLGVRRLVDWAPFTLSTLCVCGVFLGAGVMAVYLLGKREPAMPSPWQVAAVHGIIALAIYPPLFLNRQWGIAVSRLTLLLFEVLAIVAVTAWYRYHPTAIAVATGRPMRNLALVGSAEACREIAAALRSRRAYATVHAVVVSEDGISGDTEKFELLLRQTPLDEVLLVPPFLDIQPLQSNFYRSVLDICERSRVGIHICAPWLRQYDRVHLDHVGGHPVLSFDYALDESWPLLAKRAIDVTLAAIGLLLASPLLALASLAILIESGRPVLFRQTRAGLRGRPFTIYKLRTMVVDAEAKLPGLQPFNEMSSVVFKMARDPRITRVGRWLRKSSLDEVPQLVNVLRGSMSLVGPRPPLPSELKHYELDHLRRLAMKPGITGQWQVSGRSEIKDFERWVELDTHYIRTWSLGRDMVILFKTIGTVLRMSGK